MSALNGTLGIIMKFLFRFDSLRLSSAYLSLILMYVNSRSGFPVWLKFVPGISFRTDNQPFKVFYILSL